MWLLKALARISLPGTSLAETLLGAAVGLHLRHEILLNRLQNTSYLLSLAALSSSKALNRGEQHKHVTAFHLRLGLDRSVRLEILGETLENVKALLRVSHLTAAEHDGDLTRAPFLRKRRTWPFLVS